MPNRRTGRAGRRARLRKRAATRRRGAANNTFALYEAERNNYNAPENRMNMEAIMNTVRRQMDPQMYSKPKRSKSKSRKY